MISTRWRYGVVAAMILAGVAMAAAGEKRERKSADEKKEATRPTVNPAHVEQFRSSKDATRTEIVTLHNQIQGYHNEMATLKELPEDSKEGKKAGRKITALRAKIAREQRKLEKLVKDHLKPVEKVYEDKKRKYDLNKSKAKKLEEDGRDKKAVTYHQEADKFTGKMQGAKREIDTARWFLFYDNADPGEAE